MPRGDFRKVPTFVFELLADRSLKEVPMRVYLACIHLANFNAPRIVRASVATIAEAAGAHRTHATQALREISTATERRPALIEYTPGVNQYSTAVVRIIEHPDACTDSVHPEARACTDSAHPSVHPSVHPQHSLAGDTSSLEPESQRKSARSCDDDYLEQEAQRIERAHHREVDRPTLRRVATASELPRERFARAVSILVDRPPETVRNPMGLLPKLLEDERASYEIDLRQAEFDARPTCTHCNGELHVPTHPGIVDSPYMRCPRCDATGKEPPAEQTPPEDPYEGSTTCPH